MGKFKNFLIVRTDKVGDFILSLPVARFLKSNEVHNVMFLVRRGIGEIARRNPFIDEFFEVDVFGERGEIKPHSFISVYDFVRKADISFCLFPRFSVALLMRMAGVLSVGTSRRIFSPLFDVRVDISRKKGEHHEAYYNLLLLSPFLSIPPEVEIHSSLKPYIHVHDDEISYVKRKFSLPDDFIIFHPFSGGSSPTLPLSFWVAVAENLRKAFRVEIVWVGKFFSSSDFSFLPGISIVNRTTLSELISVICASRGIFSTSSGPIHIASACGRPTAGLYLRRDERRWKPLGKSLIFYIDGPLDPYNVSQRIGNFFEL